MTVRLFGVLPSHGGTVNSPVSKDIVLHNDGAAPLSVSSVSVDDGYSPYTAEIPLLTESEVTYNISLSKIATSLTPSDADSSDSGVYYNVYGQPVSKDYKGIVIIGERKYLICDVNQPGCNSPASRPFRF